MNFSITLLNRCSRRATSLIVAAALLILQRTAIDAQNVPGLGVDRLKGKFALVIGNGAYQGSPLRNPPNDAADMATSLRAIGFDVTATVDLDLRGMRVAIAKFVRKLADDSAALVFYSGHGVQYAGTNYLLPTDSLPWVKKPADLEKYAISLPELMRDVTARRNTVSVFILDACRDSPFSSVSGIASGLARMVPRSLERRPPHRRRGKAMSLNGVIIAYSTAPNMVALDGDGRNSPYTKHLKVALRQPNRTLEEMLKLARTGVTIETNGSQTPWYESSVNGDFYPAGRGRIDFKELLKLLIPPPHKRFDEGAAYYVYRWDLASAEFSPIEWGHDRTRPATDAAEVRDFNGRQWGHTVRTGKVVITVDGAPTHRALLRQPMAGAWHITLAGTQAGVAAVGIRADDVLHHRDKFGGFGGAHFLREDKACVRRSRLGGGGTTVYSVDLPNRIPAWLAENWSCGNHGCIREYILFFNKEDRSRVGCK